MEHFPNVSALNVNLCENETIKLVKMIFIQSEISIFEMFNQYIFYEMHKSCLSVFLAFFI